MDSTGQSQQNAASLTGEDALFQLRAVSMTLFTLKLSDPANAEFFPRLTAMLSLAPGFYRNAPIVLDLSATGGRAPIDLVAFCDKLRALGIHPVGVQRANAAWERAVAAANLVTFPAGRATAAETAASSAKVPARAAAGTRILSEPVRSGQQVYAHKGDLIVMGAVSRGAELLADGHIHVYGALRGRALAGMSGDKSARIFCRVFDAELVSIAGTYLISEQFQGDLVGKPSQVYLHEDRLVQEAI